MYRVLLTAAIAAALGVTGGIWLDGWLREARRQARADFALRVERELDKPISLTGIAGKDRSIRQVLRHIAGQVDVPMAFNGAMLDEVVYDKKQINLPQRALSLRNVLGLLSHQMAINYYADDHQLVITSDGDAEGRLTTRVYPLPQLAGPEQPFGADLETWIDVLSVVIEPDSWNGVGGAAQIVPVPGALIIRQTRRAHDRLKQFFRRLENDSPTPDAQADYLSSFSPAERRIHAALEVPRDFQCTAAPLHEVLAELSRKQGIPIVVCESKLEEAAIEPEPALTLKMQSASLRSVLRLLLEQAGLTYVIRDDVLQVTTPEDAATDLRAVVYDVRDLVVVKGGADFDSLAELITSSVQPDSWADHSGPGPLQETFPGWLIFSETDSIHEGTAHLLTLLRKALRRKMADERAVTTQTTAEQQITAALERSIKLDYQGIDLPDVVADLAERTGVNVRLDTWRLADLDRKIDIPVVCELPPLPLKTALYHLLDVKSLAPAKLAWTVRNECLLLTTELEANSQHELLILDVRGLTEPPEDKDAFAAENLVELIERVIPPKRWDGAASLSIFQSLLVVSAPREVNERVERLVEGLRKFRDQSLIARARSAERSNAHVAVWTEDEPVDGALLRIYPVEDLLGGTELSALEDLQDAIKEAVLKETWSDVGGPGETIAVPPGGLLVAQTREGHDQLRKFLDQLRQQVVPGQQMPTWLTNWKHQKQEEVRQFKESGLPAIPWFSSPPNPGRLPPWRQRPQRGCISVIPVVG